MANQIWLTQAAEVWSDDIETGCGPTGEYVEVLEGEVQDAGGNVLFAGSADECVAKRYRITTSLVPTKYRETIGATAGCDHRWQLVLERNL